MTTVAIIPARGGSRRIPRKNIRPFFGVPIIAYSIRAAHDSCLFDHVVVTTDDTEIGGVAEEHGAEVYFRNEAYGRDEVGTQAVARECLEGLSYRAHTACVIYATAPLMKLSDLIWAAEHRYLGFTMSVGYPPLRDAAQFYWGMADWFLRDVPLINPDTVLIPIAAERVCDINTMEDWTRAEKMYAKLGEKEGV